jgi:hypothetical protein
LRQRPQFEPRYRRLTTLGCTIFNDFPAFVGAGLPAKNLRAALGIRIPSLSLTTFASKLAPTGFVSDWLASEKPESGAGYQDSIVIVDDLREQARSYSPRTHALRSDRRTQSQDNAPSFSAALPCGLSDTFACLAALA